jgi:hypothetical protein
MKKIYLSMVFSILISIGIAPVTSFEAKATLITTEIDNGNVQLSNLVVWTQNGVNMLSHVSIFDITGDLLDDGSGQGLFDSTNQFFYDSTGVVGTFGFTAGQVVYNTFYQLIGGNNQILDVRLVLNYNDPIFNIATQTYSSDLNGTLFYGSKQASLLGDIDLEGNGVALYTLAVDNRSGPTTSVPEPTSLAILMLGIIGIAASRRKQIKAKFL